MDRVIEIEIRYIPDRIGQSIPMYIRQSITLEAYLSAGIDVLEHAARTAIREFSHTLDIELETVKYAPKKHSFPAPFSVEWNEAAQQFTPKTTTTPNQWNTINANSDNRQVPN